MPLEIFSLRREEEEDEFHGVIIPCYWLRLLEDDFSLSLFYTKHIFFFLNLSYMLETKDFIYIFVEINEMFGKVLIL